jgi:hypothetical protein
MVVYTNPLVNNSDEGSNAIAGQVSLEDGLRRKIGTIAMLASNADAAASAAKINEIIDKISITRMIVTYSDSSLSSSSMSSESSDSSISSLSSDSSVSSISSVSSGSSHSSASSHSSTV